jgi:hypothetical protein
MQASQPPAGRARARRRRRRARAMAARRRRRRGPAAAMPDDLMIPYGYLNLAPPMKTLQSVMPMHEL